MSTSASEVPTSEAPTNEAANTDVRLPDGGFKPLSINFTPSPELTSAYLVANGTVPPTSLIVDGRTLSPEMRARIGALNPTEFGTAYVKYAAGERFYAPASVLGSDGMIQLTALLDAHDAFGQKVRDEKAAREAATRAPSLAALAAIRAIGADPTNGPIEPLPYCDWQHLYAEERAELEALKVKIYTAWESRILGPLVDRLEGVLSRGDDEEIAATTWPDATDLLHAIDSSAHWRDYVPLSDDGRRFKAAMALVRSRAEEIRRTGRLARKEVEKREMVEWIRAHGSTRLRRCVDEGFECEGIYRDERFAMDRPGWIWADDDDRLGSDKAKPPRNPPEGAFELLDKARSMDEKARLMYLVVEEGGTETFRGFVAYATYNDREIVFGFEESDPEEE